MRRGALSAKSVGSRYDMEPAAHHGSSPDSPLEGNGFELLVRGRVKLVVGRRRTGRDGSPPRNWQISCWCGAAPPALWRSRLEKMPWCSRRPGVGGFGDGGWALAHARTGAAGL